MLSVELRDALTMILKTADDSQLVEIHEAISEEFETREENREHEEDCRCAECKEEAMYRAGDEAYDLYKEGF